MFGKIRKLHNAGLTGETVRFLMATGLSACITLLLPMGLHEIIGLSEEVAVGAGLVAAMLVNFLVVRTFVFRSSGQVGRQILRFFAMTGTFRLGEYGFFLLLHQMLEFHYMAALLIALMVSFSGKFLVSRSFVFR